MLLSIDLSAFSCTFLVFCGVKVVNDVFIHVNLIFIILEMIIVMIIGFSVWLSRIIIFISLKACFTIIIWMLIWQISLRASEKTAVFKPMVRRHQTYPTQRYRTPVRFNLLNTVLTSSAIYFGYEVINDV